MKTRTLILMCFLLFAQASSYGQVGRFLKNKAANVLNRAGREDKEKADSVAQQKAEEKVNDAADKEETKAGDTRNENRSNRQGRGINIGGLLGGKVDLKYNPEYKFDSRMYMVMETYDGKKTATIDYNIYYSKNVPNAGIEMKTVTDSKGETAPVLTRMIIDGENKCMIMLTDIENMRMGMISALPDESSGNTEQKGKAPEYKPSDFNKTGNTRTIAGYKCDEYEYKDPEQNNLQKVWMTQEKVLDIDNKTWSAAGIPAAYTYSPFEGMTILAWESYNKDNKLEAKSEVKEINPSYSQSISTQGYSMRQINYNQMQQQEQQQK
jgi:hypothetical protein